MRLKELAQGYPINGNADTEITGLAYDHRHVKKGDLFFCLSGKEHDGANFVFKAIETGAAAVVSASELPISVPYIKVDDDRAALAKISAAFYGNPSKKLKIISVVGTNGKTSTCHIIKEIIETAGKKAGLIGTLGAKYNDKCIDFGLTTPDPPRLHEILSQMAESGIEYVVMEVSAHAIALKKMYGIVSEAAVFTNFSQDHLDYFESMDSYKNTKKSFFSKQYVKKAVINADDAVGIEMIQEIKDIPFVTYGIRNPADVFAVDITMNGKGLKYVINYEDNLYEIKTPLIGQFNAYNTIASICTMGILGFSLAVCAAGVANIKTVSGRMEKVPDIKKTVIIDYAHTPDGLEKALKSLRILCKGRLICLFGCGGNRDKLKRQIMGRISGENSDFTVITSDNPRYEDAHTIISEIEKGIKPVTDNYACIADRKKATEYALKNMSDKDMLLIAGKGDEHYQEIMGVKYDYYDKQAVKELS